MAEKQTLPWYNPRRWFPGDKAIAASGRRDFAAAAVSRLTQSWTSHNTSVNADLYRSLDLLRARSRDLCNNNDYAKRFLSMVAANTIGGNGVMLQARIYNGPNQPDSGANDAVEAAWQNWSKRGVCDVTGKLSMRDLQLLVVKACARDGEALVRKIRGRTAGNAFGLALQILDIDRLDTRLIRAPESGIGEIRMGVEVDAFGRPLAYWLRPYNPGDFFLTAGSITAAHVRVPADEIIHIFSPDRPEQARGLPWMHAAMTRLNNLGGYEEAAVIAARIGASKMGFYTTPEGDSRPVSEGEDEQGVPFQEADPGSFGVLPEGYGFTPFNPDYPHAMYADFTRACLRGIASGLCVSYHALANDLENVNFSSIRSGTLDERDQWVSVQEWFIEAFCEPVFDEWIETALAFGQIKLGNGSALPAGKGDKFSQHTWQARRWNWVDPLKDMQANVLAVENGFKSPQTIAAEMGVDFEDVLVQIKQAQDLAAKLGVTLGSQTTPIRVTPPNGATASETDAAATDNGN